MPVLTTSDSIKSVSITTSRPLSIEGSDAGSFLEALDLINSTMPVDTVTFSGTSYTVTLKDARSYTVDIHIAGAPPPPPTFKLTSTSYWSRDEAAVLPVLGQSIAMLFIVDGLTAISVTFV